MKNFSRIALLRSSWPRRKNPPPHTAAARLCGWMLAAMVSLAAGTSFIALPALEAQQGQPAFLPVILADFNQDGIPDVLIQSATAPTASIAFGSVPYGTFSAVAKAVTFPAACASALPQGAVVIGDFNGDGLPDLAFSCGDGAGTLGVMLGNGDGTFAAAQTFQGPGSVTIAAGDFNHDGKLDLAVVASGEGAGIEIFSGKGDGTFTPGNFLYFPNQTSYTSPLGVDVDGDGYPDLLLLGASSSSVPTLNVFANNQDGTFGTGSSGATGGPNVSVNIPSETAASILSGNFFGTGNSSFVVPGTGTNAGFYVVKNTSTAGNFSLAAPVQILYPGLRSALTGTFTGSGFTDLIAANGTSLTVLANDGTGNFTTNYAGLSLPAPTSLFAIADSNGDGYSDVYTATLQSGVLAAAVNLVTGSASASSQPFSLSTGTKNVSASWTGNVNFSGSTAMGTQTVNGVPTATSVTSTKNPSIAGDSITITATAAPVTTSLNIPTGMLVITDNGTTLASGLVNAAGSFSYTTSALTQGAHSIQAIYAGDSYFSGSTSAIFAQVVNHAPAVAPNLTWQTPGSIVYGTPLSATQLDAVATDAITGAVVPGVFTYTPAAGTMLGAGAQTLQVSFVPSDPLSYLTGTASVVLTVTQATPVLTWPTPSNILYGIPLSAAQLDAMVAGVNGATLPGRFTYTPATGAVLLPGTQTLNVNFVPMDAIDYTAVSGSVHITVTGLSLTSVTPNTANLGDPAKTITLTGAGFISSSVVQVGGSAISTTLVSPTTLMATIPAADFLQPGTLQITVFDPSIAATSAALPFTVVAVSPVVTFSGPSTTSSGSQDTISFTVINPYPVALTASLDLNFAPSVTPPVDDPMVQFAAGGRTFSFVVPANSTAVPPIQIQSGTTAGTITVPLILTAGGVDVTPSSVQPIVIVIPPAIPSVTSATLSRSGDQLTVVMVGFSNTREMTQASFHFVAAPGAQIDTPEVTLPAGALFTTWYSTTPSDQYGSAFTYTQVFNVSGGASQIGSVQITLTNGIGESVSQTAQ
jgi:hypothetical protein